MQVNQKEIVLLPYPFTNLEGRKVRPGKIFAVEKSLVSMKISTIKDNTFDKIKAEINRMF